jgi:hypothetical protein
MGPKRELVDVEVEFTLTVHNVSVCPPESSLCYASWSATSKPSIYVTASRSHSVAPPAMITSLAEALGTLQLDRAKVRLTPRISQTITTLCCMQEAIANPGPPLVYHCKGFTAYRAAKALFV